MNGDIKSDSGSSMGSSSGTISLFDQIKDPRFWGMFILTTLIALVSGEIINNGYNVNHPPTPIPIIYLGYLWSVYYHTCGYLIYLYWFFESRSAKLYKYGEIQICLILILTLPIVWGITFYQMNSYILSLAIIALTVVICIHLVMLTSHFSGGFTVLTVLFLIWLILVFCYNIWIVARI